MPGRPKNAIQTVRLEYGAQTIPVALEFGDRKRLSISVHPDCSVTALAPADRSLEQVLTHLDRRRSWIAKQRRHFEAFHPLPEGKRFVSGETHLYLGRQYRLRIRRSTDVSVKLIGRFLNVHVSSPREPRSVENALDAWYRAHAEPIFRNQMTRCLDGAPSLPRTRPKLRIRKMVGRWGSCSSAGTITLSADLIKTPLHCIEYVIMHELCHLRVHDHSPAFFRLLRRCMPDWEDRKARLDAVVLR